MLYYKNFLYFLKVIWTKLISKYYNNLLVDHFYITKIQKLIAQNNY